MGRREKVAPQFELSGGPILVFVDDYNSRVTWPEASDLLEQAVAVELVSHGATEKVLSPDALRRLRQTHTDFEDMYCNEIGRKVGADQILWLEVADFFASEQMSDLTAAARMAVTVKVINPHGTHRDGTVRLWPASRDGHPVRAELSANEVSKVKGRRAIATALTKKLAGEVARLFYEHKLEDLVAPIEIDS